MLKQFIKITELTKQQIRSVKNLWEECRKADSFNIKLYWNIIADRQIPEFDDFLYLQNGKLIAYLAIFAFKEDCVELNAMVHPDYRHKGIFTFLFEEAVLEIRKRQISSALLICNKKSHIAEKWIKKLNNVEFDHAECQMHYVKKPNVNEAPEVEFEVATEKDIPVLARIDNECFSSTYDQIVFRFTQNMKEKVRTAYLVKHDGKVIGKCHIRIDDGDKAFIHDLCIPPEFQRKHYATAIVLKILDMYKKKGYKTIYLDVLADNEAAIKLYEKCGFEITAHHDFYRVSVESF